MSVVDPRADYLTVIRNANRNKVDKVKMFSSKLKEKISEVLKKEGFIKDYRSFTEDKKNKLEIELKYAGSEKEPVIHGLKLISKQGRRVYADSKKLPKVMGGFGIAVISTSKGLMSDKEAKKAGIGGEVICHVW